MPRRKISIPRADFLSAHGANLLARAVEQYWVRYGVNTVRATCHEMPDMPGLFVVRSNLVAGMPSNESL